MTWNQYPLSSLAIEFINGGTPSTKVPTYWEGDIPWITGADVEDHIVINARKHINKLAVENSSTHIVPKDAVLLVTRTGVGKLAKAGCDIAISQDLTGIVLKKPIDPDYAIYAIKSKIKSLSRLQQGAIIKGLLRKDVEQLTIPVPALSEQRRIVEILDQADALRKKRAEADTIAEKILPALFYRNFGIPSTNSHNLPERKIDSLVVPIKRRNPSDDPEAVFKYIDITGVDGKLGGIIETKTLQGFEAPSRARQVVNANDVIISTVRPYLRATALVPDSLHNEICSTGFCVLRARNAYGYGFLYVLTRLSWFTEKLNGMARGASYPAVTDNDILNIHVPYKDDESYQKRFDSEVTLVLYSQRKRLLLSEKIESLFNVLLHRAFTGDLTARWREAHMKELLQEMEEQTQELKIK